MLTIKNVKNIKGETVTKKILSDQDEMIDATGLTMLPAVIDPHVHFRTPGQEDKENWESGARAAIAGGVTRVFDMPNNIPACVTETLLQEKKTLINKQLSNTGIPLRYGLFFGADAGHLEEISKVKNKIVGIKVFMGSSTGSLLIDNDEVFEKVCKIAAENNLIVAAHAEDEHILQELSKQNPESKDPKTHSKNRDRKAAIVALEKCIAASVRFGTKFYILHLSIKEEVALVRQAKRKGLPIYAETTPHHLFLSEDDYEKWGTRVQMNPPLRTKEDQKVLWDAVNEGIIDTIGTDHAPHLLSEKDKPFGHAPSGIPGIETSLPLLLNARSQGKLSLEKIVELTRINTESIFKIKPNDDIVLVDLNKEKIVGDNLLKTKCRWSPFSDQNLKGWPVYTVLKGKACNLDA